MKLKAIMFAMLFCNGFFASKIVSVADKEWNNPLSWSTGSVPANPDTIVIKHYITFTTDLSIFAPTVLIIEKEGTLCGDHFLDVECGARLFNYGYVYINSGKLRDAENHNYFSAKTLVTIVGCSLPGFGTGYYNKPPGTTQVWPPVNCKTTGTNWFRDVVGIENQKVDEFSLFPNPSSSGIFLARSSQPVSVNVVNLNGQLIFSAFLENEKLIDLSDFPSGIYYAKMQLDGVTFAKKLVKE